MLPCLGEVIKIDRGTDILVNLSSGALLFVSSTCVEHDFLDLQRDWEREMLMQETLVHSWQPCPSHVDLFKLLRKMIMRILKFPGIWKVGWIFRTRMQEEMIWVTKGYPCSGEQCLKLNDRLLLAWNLELFSLALFSSCHYIFRNIAIDFSRYCHSPNVIS